MQGEYYIRLYLINAKIQSIIFGRGGGEAESGEAEADDGGDGDVHIVEGEEH